MRQQLRQFGLTSGIALLVSLPACGLSPALDSGESVSDVAPSSIVSQEAMPMSGVPLWQGHWTAPDWADHWQVRPTGAWGWDNLQVLPHPQTPNATILRVHYPAGSASPSVSRRQGVAIGGAQYYADLHVPPTDRLRLHYRVRFSEPFDFVKGGKLPGLFGGDGASGGTIPDGTDGFSTRLMWRREGAGEVYAYLPTSEDFGTSIGRGTWTFHPGEWTTIEQEVRLNQPDRADGQIRLWIDGQLVIDESGLRFRTVESLQIDGIFFSTFFGGGDPSWATPESVYVDFADFAVSIPDHAS